MRTKQIIMRKSPLTDEAIKVVPGDDRVFIVAVLGVKVPLAVACKARGTAGLWLEQAVGAFRPLQRNPHLQGHQGSELTAKNWYHVDLDRKPIH